MSNDYTACSLAIGTHSNMVLLLVRIISGQCGNGVTLTRFSLRNENEGMSCYLIKSASKAKIFQTTCP